MAAEKKAKQEIEELKAHIRKMQEAERKERRKLAEEDAIKKIKKNEELIADLQKNLAAQKQVSVSLLCFFFSFLFFCHETKPKMPQEIELQPRLVELAKVESP